MPDEKTPPELCCHKCKQPLDQPQGDCDVNHESQLELALRLSSEGQDVEGSRCRSCGAIYDGGTRCAYCGDSDPNGDADPEDLEDDEGELEEEVEVEMDEDDAGDEDLEDDGFGEDDDE